ncbi:hypothetical protein AAHE18_U057600 [Arachis hypogaea]
MDRIWTQPHTSQRHFLHLLMSFWIRKNDTKQWMRHRQLPPDLQECVRRQWMRYLCKDSRERCRNMGSTDAKWKLADHPKLPKKKLKPVAVVVLDGWGEANADQYNCIHTAETPTMDSLKKGAPERWRLVRAHGTVVELPTENDMGNSEVDHFV